MPRLGPIKRRDLIFCLRRLGFSGPEQGGSHESMRKGMLTVPIPNPQGADIDAGLLRRILREAEISKARGERL
ncbi:MAG: type II toxin-antitoxin system HicA family toxin [Tepidisphaeraceae bacterium]